MTTCYVLNEEGTHLASLSIDGRPLYPHYAKDVGIRHLRAENDILDVAVCGEVFHGAYKKTDDAGGLILCPDCAALASREGE